MGNIYTIILILKTLIDSLYISRNISLTGAIRLNISFNLSTKGMQYACDIWKRHIFSGHGYVI